MNLMQLEKDHLQRTVFAAFGEHVDGTELDNLHGSLLCHRAQTFGTRALSDQHLDAAADYLERKRQVMRLDAGETAILTAAGALESKVGQFNILRPDAKIRSLVPVTHLVERGAKTWSYEQYDSTGMAQVIESYSDDIESVTVFAKKFSGDVITIGKNYDWTWDDLNLQAKAQINVQNMKASAVSEAFERRVDSVGAKGYPGTTVYGLLNHPNITLLTAVAAASGGLTPWATAAKTSTEILADLMSCYDAVITNSKGLHKPNTLVLPLAQLRKISTKKMVLAASATGDNRTILQEFLTMAPTITSVEEFHHCDLANAAGTGPRLVMYEKNERNISMEIPVEQEQLPPQAKGLAMIVNSVGKLAGIRVPYPLSAIYMDGI